MGGGHLKSEGLRSENDIDYGEKLWAHRIIIWFAVKLIHPSEIRRGSLAFGFVCLQQFPSPDSKSKVKCSHYLPISRLKTHHAEEVLYRAELLDPPTADLFCVFLTSTERCRKRGRPT